jgi:hypothetical protein
MFSLLGTIHQDALGFLFGEGLEEDLIRLDRGKSIEVDDLDVRQG